MKNTMFDKFTEYFGGEAKAANALGIHRDNLRYMKQGRIKVRRPYRMLLEFFEHDHVQFMEVVNAVQEQRPADWTEYNRRIREAFAARLVANIDRVTEGKSNL